MRASHRVSTENDDAQRKSRMRHASFSGPFQSMSDATSCGCMIKYFSRCGPSRATCEIVGGHASWQKVKGDFISHRRARSSRSFNAKYQGITYRKRARVTEGVLEKNGCVVLRKAVLLLSHIYCMQMTYDVI